MTRMRNERPTQSGAPAKPAKAEPYPCDDFWRSGTFEVTSKSKRWRMTGWERRCGVWRLLKVPESEGQYALYLMPIEACLGVFATHHLAAALVEYADSVADFSRIALRGDSINSDGNVRAAAVQGVSAEVLKDVGSFARYALGAQTKVGA